MATLYNGWTESAEAIEARKRRILANYQAPTGNADELLQDLKFIVSDMWEIGGEVPAAVGGAE
jgi:hypothetical protein